MSKAILVMDMPTCCDECFALDDNGDYPMCRITQEQRGYTFRSRERKMDKCPLRYVPSKQYHSMYGYGKVETSEDKIWNKCIDKILGN